MIFFYIVLYILIGCIAHIIVEKIDSLVLTSKNRPEKLTGDPSVIVFWPAVLVYGIILSSIFIFSKLAEFLDYLAGSKDKEDSK